MAYPLREVLSALQAIHQQNAQSQAAPYQAGAQALQNIVNTYMQQKMMQSQQEQANRQAFNTFMTDAIKSGKVDVTKTTSNPVMVSGRPVQSVASYDQNTDTVTPSSYTPPTTEKPASLGIEDLRQMFLTGKTPQGYNMQLRPQSQMMGQYINYDPTTGQATMSGISTGRKGNALLPTPKEYKTYDYVQKTKPNGSLVYVNVHTGDETNTIPEGAHFKAVPVQDLDFKEAQTAQTMLPKLAQANNAIKQLKDLYYRAYNPQEVQPGDTMGGIMSRGKGLIERGKAYAGTNANAKTYMDAANTFASLLSKGGFMEAGVLSDADIKRAMALLPKDYSTKQEAENSFNQLEAILSAPMSRYQQLYKKYTGNDYIDPGNGIGVTPANKDPMGIR